MSNEKGETRYELERCYGTRIGQRGSSGIPTALIVTPVEWNGMEWNGMEWNGMEWNGMEWNGMEWNGMEWNGMEWSHNRKH